MSQDLLDLKGRVALVTGAGQGVGRETALLMAAHGAGTVVVNDYFEDRAAAVVREIESAGGRAHASAFDVGDLAAVQRGFAEIEAAVGSVDLLVNNAGNAGPTTELDTPPSFWETKPEDWDPWFRTNLFGVMNCCHAASAGMVARGYGRIVTVISDAARVGDGRFVAYSASKAGAAGFMRGLARAVGPHDVTANCVSLGAIQTPGLAKRRDPERVARLLKRYVIQRVGEPEDAASLILFLCSDAAGWVTGQTYAVNGGYDFSS